MRGSAHALSFVSFLREFSGELFMKVLIVVFIHAAVLLICLLGFIWVPPDGCPVNSGPTIARIP